MGHPTIKTRHMHTNHTEGFHFIAFHYRKERGRTPQTLYIIAEGCVTNYCLFNDLLGSFTPYLLCFFHVVVHIPILSPYLFRQFLYSLFLIKGIFIYLYIKFISIVTNLIINSSSYNYSDMHNFDYNYVSIFHSYHYDIKTIMI